MSDAELTLAMAELQEVVRCRCDEAYRDRGLKDPHCECDSAEAVKVVANRIEALTKERDAAEQRGYANAMEAERKLHEERIEELEAKLVKAVELLTLCRDMFGEVASPSDPLSVMLNETLAEIKLQSSEFATQKGDTP